MNISLDPVGRETAPPNPSKAAEHSNDGQRTVVLPELIEVRLSRRYIGLIHYTDPNTGLS
jgi:hypothetical protein